jgi:cytochrome c556
LTGLFGGWQAVENSALALAESADLLLIAGRTCSNGEVVDVEQADWIRFVDDFRRDSVAAYEAALTKDQDAMVDASGALSEACLACHRVYRREPTPGDATERCIPGSRAAPR